MDDIGHEQNSTVFVVNLILHEQTIISRQLFAGHRVSPRPMKRKKTALNDNIKYHDRSYERG